MLSTVFLRARWRWGLKISTHHQPNAGHYVKWRVVAQWFVTDHSTDRLMNWVSFTLNPLWGAERHKLNKGSSLPSYQSSCKCLQLSWEYEVESSGCCLLMNSAAAISETVNILTRTLPITFLKKYNCCLDCVHFPNHILSLYHFRLNLKANILSFSENVAKTQCNYINSQSQLDTFSHIWLTRNRICFMP